MSNNKIRENSIAYFDLTKEEREVLRIKDATEKRLSKEKVHAEGFGVVSAESNKQRVFEATQRGEVLIDHECLLSFPIKDARTSPTTRYNYLAQEELMIAEEQICREEANEVELSSPAREFNDRDTTNNGLSKVTPEDMESMKKANWQYLHKVFPEMDDPEVL